MPCTISSFFVLGRGTGKGGTPTGAEAQLRTAREDANMGSFVQIQA